MQHRGSDNRPLAVTVLDILQAFDPHIGCKKAIDLILIPIKTAILNNNKTT